MPHLINIMKKLRYRSLSLERLAADIEDFEVTFARYRMDHARKERERAWVEGCNAHLEKAREALRDGDVDSGYQSLLNAEREAVPLMPEEERSARVISLRNEIKDKLGNSWRGESALLLLNGKPEDVPAEAIREALLHRNTHSQNIYRKIELLRKQLAFIGGLLTVLLLIAIAIGVYGRLDVLDRPPSTSGLFPFVIYMGVLGGTWSAAFSVTRTDSSAKIPDVQRTRVIALARSALGGAAAIPVFLLIQGNLIKLMDMPFTPGAVLFFCFLAGFSERWFLSTLETFTRGKSASIQAKKG